MNTIENLIKEKGQDFSYCFVFPSYISQRICFRKALEMTGLPTVPSELYISWKVFIKEHVCLCEDKKPVTEAVKLVYAEYIMEKNAKEAAKGSPIFNSLIPEKHASESANFSTWVYSILPSLNYFLEEDSEDQELNDLHILSLDYSRFLKENNFYEPKWQEKTFNSDDKKYIIIYPELIDDFYEYESFLKQCPQIELFHLTLPNKELLLYEFENTRLEIKYVISQIEELILKGISIEDIALSVADIENLKPHIIKECNIRGIPIDLYSRENISKNGFCNFFEAIKNIVETHYSFEAIKQLFLNQSILWKEKEFVKSLLEFGIKHNCAYSWEENGKWNNVWIEAYNSISTYTKEEVATKEMFEEMKEEIEDIYYAPTFLHMKDAILKFCSKYMEEQTLEITKNKKQNKIVFNIIKDLCDTEAQLNIYFDEIGINKYKFFLSLLSKKEINLDVNGNGLSIFQYGVSTATPYKYHFVINMNQNDGSIVVGKFRFLRDDKKRTMNIKEVDLTKHIIASYNNTQNIYFSYSKKLYQGYAIAHSAFKKIENIKECHKEDSFYNEECFFIEKNYPINKIYKTQKEGIRKAKHFDNIFKFSLLDEAYHQKLPLLFEEIKKVQYKDNHIRVSATDLNTFFTDCPVKFFMSKILKIQAKDFKASMADEYMIGNMYHAILEKLYRRIQNSNSIFNKDDLSTSYLVFLEKAFCDAFEDYARKYGPLSKPFMEVMKKQIIKVIKNVLTLDASYFDRYTQYAIEGEYQFLEDDILHYGKIDRVIKDGDGLVIFDYKTWKPNSGVKVEDDMLQDYQIPFYVLLLETIEKENRQEEGQKVKAAYFLEIISNDIHRVIKSETIQENKKAGKTREEFEENIEILKQCIKKFYERITTSDFTAKNRTWKKCNECKFKNICRTTFTVRGR
ncbi:MAG: PD-(D/E)XK nuclease family protein [Treponema sp.]